MKAYSVDLRERIVRAVKEGMSQTKAARMFHVGIATVECYMRYDRQGRALAPLPNKDAPPRALPPEQHGALLAQLHERPSLTVAEHATLWRRTHGPVSDATMSRRIRTLGWMRKKDDPRQ